MFKSIFFVVSFVICGFYAFSCQAMEQEEDDSHAAAATAPIHSPRLITSPPSDRDSLEASYRTFIARSEMTFSQLKNEQTRAIGRIIIQFATLDGHYFESYEDTSINGYREIVEGEYYPLLDQLLSLDRGEVASSAFFWHVFNKFMEHLQNTVTQAKLASEEDAKFKQSIGTCGVYKTGRALNFFRDPSITPTCNEFLKKKAVELVPYWKLQQLKRINDRKGREFKAKLSSVLQEEHRKMQALQDRILPYRDAIDEFYGTLLYQAWSLLPDPNILPNKVKRALNHFEYLWSVLRTGAADNTRNIDTWIKEFALHESGPLAKVFQILEEKPRTTKLRKDLLRELPPAEEAEHSPPHEVACVGPEKASGMEKDLSPSSCIAPEKMPETPPPLVEKDPELPSKTEVKVPKPAQHFKDQQNLEVCEGAPRIRGLFEDVRQTKHIRHDQIIKLLTRLGGKILRTKGSHETWELLDAQQRPVHFGFWRLHGRDQYGPWTKKLVLDLENQLSID